MTIRHSSSLSPHLPLPHKSHAALRSPPQLGLRLWSRSKIRCSTEGAKDIANVVGGLDARGELRVPLAEDALHDLDAGNVDVLDGRGVAALVGVEEVVDAVLAGMGAVKIRGGAHEDDAGEIDGADGREASHGLEDGVVFLRSEAVDAGAVGPEASGVLEGLAEEGAREIDVGSGDVSFDDGWGGGAHAVEMGAVQVVCAVGNGGGGIFEGDTGGEIYGDVAESLVELEDFGSVDGGWVLSWLVGTLANIAGGPVLWNLASIEFVLKSHLNSIFGEGDGSESANLGRDTGDTPDEEIGGRQVELRRGEERGDGGCGVDF